MALQSSVGERVADLGDGLHGPSLIAPALELKDSPRSERPGIHADRAQSSLRSRSSSDVTAQSARCRPANLGRLAPVDRVELLEEDWSSATALFSALNPPTSRSPPWPTSPQLICGTVSANHAMPVVSRRLNAVDVGLEAAGETAGLEALVDAGRRSWPMRRCRCRSAGARAGGPASPCRSHLMILSQF